MYLVFEIIGTIAFAISGAMGAIEKKMDILGVTILGITTAMGGGIIRDVLIGMVPPAAFAHPQYLIIALLTSLIIFIPAIRKKINLESTFYIFIDALGLAIFTIVGCQSALPFSNLWLQVFLGVLTGVGGGVMRDVFAIQKPVIFVKNYYAVVSLAGAVLYSLLLRKNENLAIYLSLDFIIGFRMIAAKRKWQLPKSEK